MNTRHALLTTYLVREVTSTKICGCDERSFGPFFFFFYQDTDQNFWWTLERKRFLLTVEKKMSLCKISVCSSTVYIFIHVFVYTCIYPLHLSFMIDFFVLCNKNVDTTYLFHDWLLNTSITDVILLMEEYIT